MFVDCGFPTFYKKTKNKTNCLQINCIKYQYLKLYRCVQIIFIGFEYLRSYNCVQIKNIDLKL